MVPPCRLPANSGDRGDGISVQANRYRLFASLRGPALLTPPTLRHDAGMPEIAVVTEGMGVVWALLLVFPVLAVAYQEGGFQHNMPQTAILCAPFALCGAGFWAVSQQYSPDTTKEWAFLFHLLYFSAIVCYLVVLVQMPSMLSQGVSEPPFAAALTFPFTIVGTAMVRAHTSLEPPAAGHLFSQIFAVFAACASVLVVWTVAARYLAHYLLKPPEEPATMAKPTSGEATEVGPNDSHGTTVHTSTVDVEMAAASPRHPAPGVVTEEQKALSDPPSSAAAGA